MKSVINLQKNGDHFAMEVVGINGLQLVAKVEDVTFRLYTEIGTYERISASKLIDSFRMIESVNLLADDKDKEES